MAMILAPDQAKNQAEKQLSELGDSVDDASKKEIQDAIADVRGVLESEDPAEIAAKAEALQASFHKVSEQMYAQAAQQAESANGADAGAATEDGDAEEVVDAEVVDDKES